MLPRPGTPTIGSTLVKLAIRISRIHDLTVKQSQNKETSEVP